MKTKLTALEALKRYGLPFTYENQARSEFGNSSVDRELSRRAAIAALEADIAKPVEPPKMAPVQGYTPGIPWSIHLEAYDVYRKKYGAQQALIEGWCRGGFGVGELDAFIPGWRDRVSEIGKLRSEIAALKATPQKPAAAEWMPIETAPKDGTPIDIWRSSNGGERCAEMRRVVLGGGNVFYEPVHSGYSCVRDATHWMPLPAAPGGAA